MEIAKITPPHTINITFGTTISGISHYTTHGVNNPYTNTQHAHVYPPHNNMNGLPNTDHGTASSDTAPHPYHGVHNPYSNAQNSSTNHAPNTHVNPTHNDSEPQSTGPTRPPNQTNQATFMGRNLDVG